MNKSNLTTGLVALCAVLLLVLLVRQSQQTIQLESLRQHHEAFASSTTQRHQEVRDHVSQLTDRMVAVDTNLNLNLARNAQLTAEAMSALSNKVLSLATNWETELTPRLTAKSDEIVAAFSDRLDQKVSEATEQVANAMRQQAEVAIHVNAVVRSNKTARLLQAASGYEKANRPELAELCYLSALRTSDGNPWLVLKPMLDWQERKLESMSESDWITKGAATLISLYETLDKTLPESSASAENMEAALVITDRMQARIVDRQNTKLDEIRGKLSWDKFAAESLSGYERLKETLVSLSPANPSLEGAKSELVETADHLIQTARATDSFTTADIVPPSTKTPMRVATNWLERGLVFIASPTNATQAKLAAVSVLMSFVQERTEIPAWQGYAQTLTNETVRLAWAQWAERVKALDRLVDTRDKPDAETLAVAQSLLNQGLGMLKTFPTNGCTAEISTTLPDLASRLYWAREQLLVAQMRLAESPGVFSSKEQTARARGLIYGQILSAMFDAKTLEAEISKQCTPANESLGTLKSVQRRFGEYLTAYDQFGIADGEEAKAIQLAKHRQQLQRYADHCQRIISSASSRYDEAADRASGLRPYTDEPEWIAKWTNQRPQKVLKEGLHLLYSIEINDLRQADPGLGNLWDSNNEKLKKNLTDWQTIAPAIDAQTPKKSKFDF